MKSKAITAMQQKAKKLTNISVLLIDESTTLISRATTTSLLFDCVLSQDDLSDPVNFGIKNSYYDA